MDDAKIASSVPSRRRFMYVLASTSTMLPANDLPFRVGMLENMRMPLPAAAFAGMFAAATVNLSMGEIVDLAERLVANVAE